MTDRQATAIALASSGAFAAFMAWVLYWAVTAEPMVEKPRVVRDCLAPAHTPY